MMADVIRNWWQRLISWVKDRNGKLNKAVVHHLPVDALIIVTLAALGFSSWRGMTTEQWAGLGQWVGGIGAFFAAVVAVRIANSGARREQRREDDREQRRLKAHAHYISAAWNDVIVGQSVRVAVVHNGTEPVLNVDIVGVHRDRDFCVAALRSLGPEQPVLLPDEHWRPEVQMVGQEVGAKALEELIGPDTYIEITFEDLNGTKWRRVGRFPPVVVEQA
jgi:hypothetical protein